MALAPEVLRSLEVMVKPLPLLPTFAARQYKPIHDFVKTTFKFNIPSSRTVFDLYIKRIPQGRLFTVKLDNHLETLSLIEEDCINSSD